MTSRSALPVLFLAACLLLPACGPLPGQPTQQPGETGSEITSAPIEAGVGEVETGLETPTATAQPEGSAETYGPGIEDFPAGINPLTGLPVADPGLLELPAILISIPHFPASARPQAGLSFAPWVFEVYIGEGMTRFLAAFYGEAPRLEPILTGSCPVATGTPSPDQGLIGNRAWFDSDADGVQDPGEPGIAGLCVGLHDASGALLESTATDSNGYYAFPVPAQSPYRIGFELPEGLAFTLPHVGLDEADSDADPASGMTEAIESTGSDQDWDAGYTAEAPGGEAGSLPAGGGLIDLPPAEIGPIRSMRLPYGRIGAFFQGGCIVAASGDPSVLAQVPGCRYVYGDDASDINSALLDLTELTRLAEANRKTYPLNYSGNLFDPAVPAGGLAADRLQVDWNWQNQSLFRYDPASGAYQRFANLPDTPLEFFPQTDRLTGRQLLVENVIVMFVEHVFFSATKIDYNLAIGMMGRADLFRDGRLYRIYWSTLAGEYEQETQRLRPIRFTDAEGNPFPLHPGHAWVNVFTPGSALYETEAGAWMGDFYAPAAP